MRDELPADHLFGVTGWPKVNQPQSDMRLGDIFEHKGTGTLWVCKVVTRKVSDRFGEHGFTEVTLELHQSGTYK